MFGMIATVVENPVPDQFTFWLLTGIISFCIFLFNETRKNAKDIKTVSSKLEKELAEMNTSLKLIAQSLTYEVEIVKIRNGENK